MRINSRAKQVLKKIIILLLTPILALILLLGYVQAIGEAHRVKDINPGPADSVPYLIFQLNDTIYFGADDGTYGKELWKSDGTEGGTIMVKNINPLTNANNGSSGPSDFAALNNTLFFNAYNGVSGWWQLWKSDGTADGTVLVTDSGPGAGMSNVMGLININDTLYFSGYDSTYGSELWKSDGTADGTVLVKNINPSGGSWPGDLTGVGGTIFFRADDGTNGNELWKSDGTVTGTTMVTDINPSGSSNVGLWDSAEINGEIFFAADDGTNGFELWKSDGAMTGTKLVTDINPAGDSYPNSLTNINSELYFITTGCDGWSKLWKSDGTTAGTVMIKEISPINACNASCLFGDKCSPRGLAGIDGIYYFVNDDGTNGFELWKSDGTDSGTVLVKDINPGSNNAFGWEFAFAAIDGVLYFVASDDTVSGQLWQSDGTASGTVRLTNIDPGYGGLPGFKIIKMNNTLFFRAIDQSGGDELWALPLEPAMPDPILVYLPVIRK